MKVRSRPHSRSYVFVDANARNARHRFDRMISFRALLRNQAGGMQPRIQAFPSVAIAALNGGMVSSRAFVRLSCEMKIASLQQA